MEIVKYFGIIIILNVSCSHNNLLISQNSENELTNYIKSKLYQGIKNQNCTDFLDTISSFYFSREINNSFNEINTAIDSLQIYNEKNKFIKKRTSDGCLSSYYALIALKYSLKFQNQSNEFKIKNIFNELMIKKTNNEIYSSEVILLEYLYGQNNTNNTFEELFRLGNEIEKDIIIKVIICSPDLDKKYKFLNDIDYSKQSKSIQSQIDLWKEKILKHIQNDNLN